MFEDILYGVVGGVSYSILAYLGKWRAEPTLEFSFGKLLYSGTLGVVVGVIASVMKVDFTSAGALWVTFGGTALLNEGFKRLWNWAKVVEPAPTGKR